MVSIWLDWLGPWCIRFYASLLVRSAASPALGQTAAHPGRLQSIQQTAEDALFFVVITIADPHLELKRIDLGGGQPQTLALVVPSARRQRRALTVWFCLIRALALWAGLPPLAARWLRRRN